MASFNAEWKNIYISHTHLMLRFLFFILYIQTHRLQSQRSGLQTALAVTRANFEGREISFSFGGGQNFERPNVERPIFRISKGQKIS